MAHHPAPGPSTGLADRARRQGSQTGLAPTARPPLLAPQAHKSDALGVSSAMHCIRLVRPSLALALGALLLAAPLSQPAAQTPVEQDDAEFALRITPEVKVVRKAGPAVVYIETDVVVERVIDIFGRRARGRGTSRGSGVVLFADGYVVTNAHVVAGARTARVRFDPTHDERTYEAEVLSAVGEEDLALLKIKADGPFPTVEMGTSSDLMPGERVVAIGNPVGQSHTVSTGIVSGLHREVNLQTETGTTLRFTNLIQTDASINPGNSGGPLLNVHGKLIGINTAMQQGAENIGFAIPVDRIKQVLEEELLSPAHARAWLGGDFDVDTLAFSDLVAGGPAARAGIQNGDLLVSIDDRAIDGPEALRLQRVSLEVGRPTRLRLRRPGTSEGTGLEVVVEPWSWIDARLYTRMGLRTEPIVIGRSLAALQRRLRVIDLRPDGAARRLGLQVGDILDGLRVDCQPEYAPGDNIRAATDALTLALLIHGKPPGCRIELDVLRDENGDGRLERGGDAPEMFRGTLELE
ncbi:MAG: trypsin-like serine protease [Planctomycetes bacterium]|nr:trypsin-like serine protease [Planctomycetota bacterium]